MIHLTIGKPASGMSNIGVLHAISFGDSPAENSEASGASEVKDGQGVSTLTIDGHPVHRTYLESLERLSVNAAFLRRKFFASKRASDSDAYQDGWMALRDKECEYVRDLRKWGCLLHVGCVK